jgi:hypothetical protein
MTLMSCTKVENFWINRMIVSFTRRTSVS